MRRIAPWFLVVGFVLAIFGSKLWLIDFAGGDVPTMDQWDAISENVLRPWTEHRLTFADLFQPHNEHRLATTKLFSLGLVAANGQWSAYAEMVVSAAVHAACALILLLLARRWLSGGHLIVFGLLLLGLFGGTFAWENTLSGFQIQFYLLLLFALGQIGLSLRSERFDLAWGLGQISGLLALASMASGFLSSLAVLVAVGCRAIYSRRLASQPAVTAILAAALCVAGWLLRTPFPPHESLKASEPGQFLAGLTLLLSWPGPVWLPWVVAPALWALWRKLRERPQPSSDAILVGLAAWSVLQIAALTYGRGGGGYLLSSRYLDLLSVNVALGYIFLVRHTPERLRNRLAACWLGLTLLMVAAKSHHEFQVVIAPNAAFHVQQEEHLRRYISEGDASEILGRTWPEISYPDAKTLIHRLETQPVRQLLPPTVRAVVPLTANVPSPPQALPTALHSPDRPVAVSTFALPREDRSFSWQSPPQSSSALPLLRFRIAGDLGRPGVKLTLQVRSRAGTVAVVPESVPGLHWKSVTIARPAGPWRVEVRDDDPNAWFACTAPVEVGWGTWAAEKLLKHHAFILGAGLGLMVLGALPIGWKQMRPRDWRPSSRGAGVVAFIVLCGAASLCAISAHRLGFLGNLRNPTLANSAEAARLFPCRLRDSAENFAPAVGAAPGARDSILWCGTWIEGDSFTGTVETASFPLQAGTLTVPVLGYPVSPGIRLTLEVTDDSGALVEAMTYAAASPGEQPAAWQVNIPQWQHRRARLVLSDQNAGSFGWLAVGAPQFRLTAGADWLYAASDNLAWFLIAAAGLATLLFLPGLALNAWCHSRLTLSPAALAVPGLMIEAGLGLAVWLLPDEDLRSLSLIWCGGHAAVAWWLAISIWRRGHPLDRSSLADFGVYGSIVLAALAFAVFPPSVAQEFEAHSPARARMIASPPDHTIPYQTAKYISAHKDGREARVAYFGDDWAITSRGPLAPLGIAAGFAVLGETPGTHTPDRAWPADETAFYVARIFGILTNTLVVLAAATLAARLMTPAAGRFALAWLACSPLLAIHTDYLWPKLLASFFLCLALTSICTRQASWRAGGWTALAYLSHPVGGLFAPVLALFIAYRERRSISRSFGAVGGFCLALIVCLLPWLFYKIWVGWPETMMRYPMGDGRGFAWAADIWTWLRCRWDNLWFTAVPGAFFFSGQMTSWLYGPLSEPLRWAVGYAKSLPGAVGLVAYGLVLWHLARQPADKNLAHFRLLLGVAALALLVFWGFSSDGLGRNCLEPLAVLTIVYTAASSTVISGFHRWLPLLAAGESLSVRAIGVIFTPDFSCSSLDRYALAAGAVVIAACLAPAIWFLRSSADSSSVKP